MKKFQISKTIDNKPDDNCCNDKIKEIIIYNKTKKTYIIPEDLLLEKLPLDVVNSFLDLLNRVCSLK